MIPSLSSLIKKEASLIGFSNCAFAKVESLAKQKTYLSEWLKKEYHSQMKYLENHFEKRIDPRILFEGAKSMVVVSLNYYSDIDLCKNSNYKISKYAYGIDYHLILKEKLNLLLASIKKENVNCKGKICVDSAPVMEKVWAEKSGIGWIGKNTCLINKKIGSFHFLGELILNIDLDYDIPAKNYCGNCKKCIDACPTNALKEPYVLDANKCLSFLTIESKQKMSDEFAKKSKGWIFGCDICQDICPWNKFAKKHTVKEFEPLDVTKKLIDDGCYSFSNMEFADKFKKSPIIRADYQVLKQNILTLDTISENSK
jgi:epoxyqueuosine reductase